MQEQTLWSDLCTSLSLDVKEWQKVNAHHEENGNAAGAIGLGYGDFLATTSEISPSWFSRNGNFGIPLHEND